MPLTEDVKSAIIEESVLLREKAKNYLYQNVMGSFPDIIEDISSRKAAYQILEHQIGMVFAILFNFQ